MKKVTGFLILTLTVSCSINLLQAQGTTAYSILPESEIWIDGTSNRSDWTVYATEYAGSVTMNESVTSEDPGISAVNLTVVSEKLESRKSSIMDRLMYKTLKVPQHSEIEFVLEDTEVTAADGDNFTLNSKGNLTIAGVTKEIELEVKGLVLGDGNVVFEGSYDMLMTDYGLTKPTAMFGALRTADEITVNFKLMAGK